MFFGSVGEKAEVADTHETIGQDVEQEAAPVWRARRRLDCIPQRRGSSLFGVFSLSGAKSGLDLISDSNVISKQTMPDTFSDTFSKQCLTPFPFSL